MGGNSFGQIFRITTFGESHGKAVGIVIDGCPPRMKISEVEIQKEVDKRKPISLKTSTSRREEDKIQILSGIFQGKTLGSPITILVENKAQRSEDYSKLKDVFREGHADLTYELKYGIRDHRGGGRSSGRETVARVIAGAIARKILPTKTKIKSSIIRIGNLKGEKLSLSDIEKYVENIDDDSCGGVVKIIVHNPPTGLGEPVFDKLDADLAKAIMSVGAVKGIEIGSGFAVANLKGSENIEKGANHAGGILGGISNGDEIVLRVAVKPTSSINIGGRHDKCIVPRIVPVLESMVAIILADHYLRQKSNN